MRSSIRTMNTLQVQQIRPLMLSVATHFEKTQAEKAFRLFVSWTVRFLIAGGGRGGQLEAAYCSSAQKVSEGKITTAKELAKEMADFVPSNAEFKNEFAVARVSKSHLARYYLRALELKLMNDPEPEFIPNDDFVINLEHILPENPGKNWSGIDPDTAVAVYKRLGNLGFVKK